MKTNATPNPSNEIPSLETIQKYLDGAMGVEEKRQFELLMAANPLVMDAVEGLSFDTSQTSQRVSELQDRIESKSKNLLAPKTHWLTITMGMAASIAVLVGLGLMFWPNINRKEISQEQSPKPTAQPLAMEPVAQPKAETELSAADKAPITMPAAKPKPETAPKGTFGGSPPPQAISMSETSAPVAEKESGNSTIEANKEEVVSKMVEAESDATADRDKNIAASAPAGPAVVKNRWEEEMLAFVPMENATIEKKAKRRIQSSADEMPAASPMTSSEQSPTEASIRAKMAKGLWAEALKDIETWEKTKPNEPVCLWLKAIVLLHNSDTEAAKVVLDALAQKPNPYQSKAREIKARIR